MHPQAQNWFTRWATRPNPAPEAAALAAVKHGARVSVVIPARNEEPTIAAVVTAIRHALVESCELVDELLVVDADSTDSTAARAQRAGAQVVRQADILPGTGNGVGKGEALWKGLAASTGDLVVFVDADILDFDHRYITGLLAPLLADSGIAFVKACYDRPLYAGGVLVAGGGGRVTEALARPLLNLYWPELAGVVQPLAGEYAARRTLLERLGFVTGYGVDLALLIDAFTEVGLAGLAQVDLGRRVHRNRSDAELGRMAAEILQTAAGRAGRGPGHWPPAHREASARWLTQFSRGRDGAWIPEEHVVEVRERPPLAHLARYAGSAQG